MGRDTGTSTGLSGIGMGVGPAAGTDPQGAVEGDEVLYDATGAWSDSCVGPHDQSVSADPQESVRASAGRSNSKGQAEGPSQSGLAL